jgi:hypothetical protein
MIWTESLDWIAIKERQSRVPQYSKGMDQEVSFHVAPTYFDVVDGLTDLGGFDRYA